MINIEGLDKADVLAALYNASRPQGMGFLQFDPTPMTRDQARDLLDVTTYFDYLKGRVMKVSLESDVEFDPRLYDRDNGQGAALAVITALREQESTDNDVTRNLNRQGTQDAAELARGMMQETGEVKDEGNFRVVSLGLSDVAGELSPKVDAALDVVEGR